MKKYERRLVAFIDILGFSAYVKESEKDSSKLEVLFSALKSLKKYETPGKWNQKIIEVEEDAQKKGIENFEIAKHTNCTCFSDSIIISVNLTELEINAATSTLVANISMIGAYLLSKGLLIRGGLTVGNLIHTEDNIVVGQALIEAHSIESNTSVFPRIVVSKSLLNDLQYPITQKKDRYPYHQYLKRFEDGCVGFHQLIFYEVMQAALEDDSNFLRDNLNKAKSAIIAGLDEHFNNSALFAKYNWLKTKYNDLIILDEQLKSPIRKLNEGISGNNIHYKYTDDFYTKGKKISTHNSE